MRIAAIGAYFDEVESLRNPLPAVAALICALALPPPAGAQPLPNPSYTREQLETAQNMMGQSATVSDIAKNTGLSRQTVYRIKDDPAGAEASLTAWDERPFEAAA